LTTVAAAVFMMTSLLLAFASSQRVSSIMKEKPAQTAPAPETPSPVPAQPQAPAPEPKP
jgi:preprotein translocase subunit SecG